MGMEICCGKEKFKILDMFRYLNFKFKFNKDHPNYFYPDGLLCFVGPQGTGKTLSAVNYVYKLMEMYPMCKLCTNILLTDYPIVTYEEFKENCNDFIKKLKQQEETEFTIEKLLHEKYLSENRVFPFNNDDDFKKYCNGEYGFIFFVDEIQLYLNSLESKNVNLETVVQISQQRKQRKHIVSTSQVFSRMAKPLREQFSNVIVCKDYLGFIQRNKMISRDEIDDDNSSDTKIKGKVIKNFTWTHNPEMYGRYDTYYVIEKGKFVSGEKQKEGLYAVKLSGNN